MQRFGIPQNRSDPFAAPQPNRMPAQGQAQPRQDSFSSSSPYGQQSGGAYAAWSPQTPSGINYSPGIGKQVITDYRNPQTGQTFQAPSSNYRPQPGSGWERVDGQAYSPPPAQAVRPNPSPAPPSSGYTTPGRPDARTPDSIFQDQYNSEAFQRSIRDKPAAFVQKRVDGLRQQAEKQYWVDEQARRVAGTDQSHQKNMADTWAYVSSLPAEQQRRLRQDPNAQQMFQELQEWRQGAPPALRAPGGAQPTSQQTPSQAQPTQDQGARIRELLQGFNVPAGVMDQISGMFGGGQPAQSQPPQSQQQFPQMPPPTPGFDQFGTPAAQQQMYQDSMMAWTMPKQNLLGWGQQAVQQPWSPNYGNMPANFRPMPYEISYNNPFGSSPMDITQNRDAFIGSILNNQANRFVGTQTQPGPVNRPAYDPAQLWQQAQGMLGGGWQNPFAAR